jgi:hypothetical protein
VYKNIKDERFNVVDIKDAKMERPIFFTPAVTSGEVQPQSTHM